MRFCVSERRLDHEDHHDQSSEQRTHLGPSLVFLEPSRGVPGTYGSVRDRPSRQREPGQTVALQRALRSGPVLLLPAVVVLAAAASIDSGCATTGHAAPDLGAAQTDAGPTAPVAAPALGVSLFAQACTPGQVAVDWSPLRRGLA